MSQTSSPAPREFKTVGLPPFIYRSELPLFQVSPGIPLGDALAQASDLLSLAKAFAEDAAYNKDSDRHAWAAHYLTTMGKAVVDDVVQALAA